MASTSTAPTAAAPVTANPAYQAFLVLRAGFTAAPILFGLDKFAGLMADWPEYLWPGVAEALPLSARGVMLAVGVVEVAAGVLVLARPRIGGYVVTAWLAVIIANLALIGGFWDIALRDFGLLLGALALARLASAFEGSQGAMATARR